MPRTNVERLEVAVDYSVGVEVAHAGGDGDEPLQHLRLAQIPPARALFQQRVVQIALGCMLKSHDQNRVGPMAAVAASAIAAEVADQVGMPRHALVQRHLVVQVVPVPELGDAPLLEHHALACGPVPPNVDGAAGAAVNLFDDSKIFGGEGLTLLGTRCRRHCQESGEKEERQQDRVKVSGESGKRSNLLSLAEVSL